jgi:hypothetical protein
VSPTAALSLCLALRLPHPGSLTVSQGAAVVVVTDRGGGWYDVALHPAVVGEFTLRVSLSDTASHTTVIKSFRGRCAQTS